MSACLVQPASAAAVYPAKPIAVIAPYTAGGTNHLMTQLIVEVSKKYLGQPLVIVNRPGDGGSSGVAEALHAPPDGYTLISLPTNYFSTISYTQRISFDPNDLVPLVNFMRYRNGLIIKENSPYKTFNDLLDYAKKNPGKLRWGHPERGSALFMQTYLIFKQAGVQTTDVDCHGGPEALKAVVSGDVEFAPVSYGSSRKHIMAGNVRYILVFTDKRFPEAPNAATAKELGFNSAAKFNTMLGIYTHKNVPEGIRKTLYNAFKQTFDDPAFQKAFEAFGEQPLFAEPETILNQIREEVALTTPLLKEWGLYVGR